MMRLNLLCFRAAALYRLSIIPLVLTWGGDLQMHAATIHSDIVVYGATSGGITAAIQAASMGKSVALLSQNAHVGGMTSGGLGQTDTGENPSSITGLSKNFYNRIKAHYGSGSGFQFEPKIAELKFKQMLAEAGIVPRYWQRIASTQMNGQYITGITMEDGSIYTGKMFIDTSYEGTLTYTEDKTATDVTLTVEGSDNLRTWSTSAAVVEEISRSTAGSLDTVTVRIPHPVPPGGTAFLRLRATQN